ncbi:MAG: hypothetical protein EAZ42_11125 [Verrucomicrobia bacterium]|nr:MAG: hypothetical protein EAZ42_11125 [Verrucomicrobiota bacterium]
MKVNLSQHDRSGFTLMELMLCVFIFTALMIISIMAHRQTRLQANEAVSISRLRELVAANLMHAAEKGTYAPATDRANRKRWHGGRSIAGQRFDPTKGFLAPYLNESERVSKCPEFDRMVLTKTSWEDGSGGYGYNATYIGGLPENPFRPNRPTQVPRPSSTLMFATTALAKSDGLQEYPFAEPFQWVNTSGKLSGPLQPSVHFRFGKNALIAWCDGHVTQEVTSDKSVLNHYGGSNSEHQIGFCGPSENNGWWNPTKEPNPD